MCPDDRPWPGYPLLLSHSHTTGLNTALMHWPMDHWDTWLLMHSQQRFLWVLPSVQENLGTKPTKTDTCASSDTLNHHSTLTVLMCLSHTK